MSLCKPTTPTRLNVIITSYVLLLTISSVLVNLAQLVVGEAVRKDFAPKLIHQPQSVELPANSPHTIECPIEAQPVTEVRWFKDDQVLASRPPHSELMGNDLMFFSLQEQDSGLYHCQVSNYLGSLTSERFSLTIQTTVRDAEIKLEPARLEVVAEQQAQFTCTLPAARKLTDSDERLGWRRNGRRLLVKWLDEGEEPSDARSRLVARRTGEAQYTLTILRVHAKDDNATFTCHGPEQADGLARESNPAQLHVMPAVEAPEDPGRRNSSSLTELEQPGSRRPKPSLHETLEDLFDLVKPGLLLVGLVFSFASLVLLLLQLLYMRRRSGQSANRYMKHPSAGQLYASGGTSSSSCTSGGVGGSASFESDTTDGLLRDPVLSSLMGRTLLAGQQQQQQAIFKQRSYRDNWRKVAAADADSGAHLFRGPMEPNLYNQSLAAREQARSLLQTSEHMRSLGNLNAPGALKRAGKPFSMKTSNLNGSHLNLPLSFGLAAAENGPLWQAEEDEHYQLVKCDPSSSESSASSLAGGQQRRPNNHYSVIEPSRDEHEARYTEVDARWPGQQNPTTGCPKLGPRFGSSRTSRRVGQGQHDQLSPYAVSSICSALPPPVNSEAMRALNEQFDINQLMLFEQGQQQQEASKPAGVQLFDASVPLPPPPPPARHTPT